MRYPDQDAARRVLHLAGNDRRFSAELGLTTRRREARIYRCDRCGGYHLTSQLEAGGSNAA
ncbi:hypothetical protein [Enemella evansiae]|uniref:hypothetical protein n=1 Tax=Enemella evansiae TaxID=2016499 RepID=UPI000B965D04|nr:hypothetical protein [Enemella evansiae]OYO02622.1 hypothetical protein CGZ97_14540 [Enemella evansiae]